MKILITGSAGFIGFNFSKFLLVNTNFKIIGIDNFNDYYDVNLKRNRNKILLKFKNYKFKNSGPFFCRNQSWSLHSGIRQKKERSSGILRKKYRFSISNSRRCFRLFF